MEKSTWTPEGLCLLEVSFDSCELASLPPEHLDAVLSEKSRKLTNITVVLIILTADLVSFTCLIRVCVFKVVLV